MTASTRLQPSTVTEFSTEYNCEEYQESRPCVTGERHSFVSAYFVQPTPTVFVQKWIDGDTSSRSRANRYGRWVDTDVVKTPAKLGGWKPAADKLTLFAHHTGDFVCVHCGTHANVTPQKWSHREPTLKSLNRPSKAEREQLQARPIRLVLDELGRERTKRDPVPPDVATCIQYGFQPITRPANYFWLDLQRDMALLERSK